MYTEVIIEIWEFVYTILDINAANINNVIRIVNTSHERLLCEYVYKALLCGAVLYIILYILYNA